MRVSHHGVLEHVQADTPLGRPGEHSGRLAFPPWVLGLVLFTTGRALGDHVGLGPFLKVPRGQAGAAAGTVESGREGQQHR